MLSYQSRIDSIVFMAILHPVSCWRVFHVSTISTLLLVAPPRTNVLGLCLNSTMVHDRSPRSLSDNPDFLLTTLKIQSPSPFCVSSSPMARYFVTAIGKTARYTLLPCIEGCRKTLCFCLTRSAS